MMAHRILIACLAFFFFLAQARAQSNVNCINVDCGTIQANWELLEGNEAIVCEGEDFQLRSAESTPLSNINEFHWYFIESATGRVLYDVVKQDTGLVTFNYEVSDSLACESSSVIPLTVTLVVSSPTCGDGKRSCNYKTSSLVVNLRPRARFSTVQEVCVNTVFNPHNLSCHGTEFLWDFGDGTTSTEEFPSHQYAQTGEYTITLTARNGCGEARKSQKIRVVGFPEADFTYALDPADACLPVTGTFIDRSNEWSKIEWFITPKDFNKWMFTGKDTAINNWYFRNDTLTRLSGFDTLNVRYRQAGEYTVRLVADNVCDMPDEKMEIINIYTKPDISLSSPGSFCDSKTISFADVALDTSGTITEFFWTFENGTPASYTGYEFPDVTFNQSGNISLRITSPCGEITRSVPIIVGTTEPIRFSDANPDRICPNGDPVQFNAEPPNGIWTGSGAAENAMTNEGLLDPKLLPGTPNGVYTLVYSNGAQDCPNLDSIQIEVQEAISVELMTEPRACEQLNYTPAVSYSGEIDTYNWTFTGGSQTSASAPFPGPLSYSSPDTSLVIIAVTGECGTASDTIEIQVQARTPVAITPLPGPLCTGSAPDTLRADVPGGIWTGNGIISPTEGIFDPATVLPGIHPVTYTLENGACSNAADLDVEVVASQEVNIDDELICEDSDPIQLTTDQPGGAWSGNGVDPVAGIFTPSGDGIYPVAYFFTDLNNCEVRADALVTVERLPVISIRKDTVDLCLSGIDVNAGVVLMYSAQDFSATPGAGTTTWSSPDVNISAGGSFNTGALAEGLYTFYVQYDRNDCSVIDSAVIRVIQAAELTLSPDTSVCIADGFLQLEANLAGGRWSGGPEIDPVTGRIDLNAASDGTESTVKNYTYVYQEDTNCEQVKDVQVEIIDLSRIVQAGPDTEICEGPDRYALTGASPANGYWLGMAVNRQTGEIDLTQLEPDIDYVYEYCIETDKVEACSACSSRIFRINANPQARFSVDEFVCIQQDIGLSNLSDNAVRYFWDFGDGSSYQENLPAHRYTQKGTYQIELIAESERGACRDTVVGSTYVTTPAVPAFTLRENEGCAPFTLDITNNSQGDSISSVWYIAGDTIPGADPGPVILDNITADTHFPIVLAVTNLCGEVRAEDSVLAHPYPIVEFGINEDEGCSPLPIEFSNTTLGDPDVFYWDLGNGQTSTDALPSDQLYYTPDDSISIYTVTLRAENECGADTLSKEITVYPPDVEAFIEMDTLRGCTPLTFTVESYSTPGAAISWRFIDPDGVPADGSTDRRPQITLVKPGLHTLVLYASNCGTDTDTAYVEVLPAPQVSFTHTPYVCLGQPIQFANQSIDVSRSFWEFGDGDTSNLNSPFHTFDSAGVYTVTLTAWSFLNNCPTTFVSQVTVVGNPAARFVPSTTNGCGPLDIDFDNQSTGQGRLKYLWDFGDGTSNAFLENPSHRFRRPGNYVVSLRVYDDNGCFSDTAVVNVLVFDDPVSQFSIPDQLYCLDYDDIQLENISIDAVSYQWQFQDTSSTDRNPAFRPGRSGIYPIELIVENGFTCKDTSRQEIEILDAPRALFSVDNETGCEELVVRFENQSTFSDRFTWSFGDGNSSTDARPRHTYFEDGVFEVSLVAASTNGCPSDRTEAQINVLPKPTADFSYIKPQQCGAPVEVVFQNNSQGNLDNSWDFGDGSPLSDLTAPAHTYTNIGLYEVSLIIRNDVGCLDTMALDIDIFGRPEAGFVAPLEGCQPFNVNLINTSTESLAYIWKVESKPASSLESPGYEFTQVGRYDVELIAIYNDLCRDTLFVEDAIRVYESPVADFRHETNRLENLIGDVQFFNMSANADRFLWDFGDGNQSTEYNPFHEYDINRSITATLTAYNDNGGQYTCSDSSQQAIEPEWITTFYVPNALAPEYGAEEVRVFQPKGIGMAEYTIDIYSPWGQLVWRSTALENSSPSEAWNGRINNSGDLVPQGVYTWSVKITFVNGDILTEVGTVTVLR